jgi:hypothetical protein
MSATRPRVLFVYFTVTQQTLRAVEAIANTLIKRGCDVQQARIEFTDPRYADRFSHFPFKHPYLLVAGMFLPQLRRATGQIRVPETVREGDYEQLGYREDAGNQKRRQVSLLCFSAHLPRLNRLRSTGLDRLLIASPIGLRDDSRGAR